MNALLPIHFKFTILELKEGGYYAGYHRFKECGRVHQETAP